MEASGTPAEGGAGAQVPATLQRWAAWSWRLLAVLALTAVAIFVLWHLRVVWVPIFIALLCSTVLLPLTDRLDRAGLPRALAVLVSMLIFIGVIALAVTLIVGSIVGEAGQLGHLISSGASFVSNATQPNDGPLSLDRESVRGVIADLGSGLQSAGSKVLAKAASEAHLAVQVVVGGVLSIAFLIYLLSDSQGIREWLVRSGGSKRGKAIEEVVDEGWESLGGYVKGTLVVAVFVSFFIGVAVFALGLPIAGTLVAITFFATFIPIVGAWIAALIITLIAFAGGGTDAGLIMIAVQVVVHGAESLWLAPRAYHKALNLNPIVILAAVTAGTALMGVVGAILAVPLVGFVWVLIKRFNAAGPAPADATGAAES